MSRIRSVTISESVLFQEASPILPPASDVLPLNAPSFQIAYPNPIKVIDPRAIPTGGAADASHDHLYPDCYAGYGKWEVTHVGVTNANVSAIRWTLIKMPKGTYKLTTAHTFWRYSTNPPGGNPQHVSLQVEPRAWAVYYTTPLPPITTWDSPPEFRLLMNEGESLWATSEPGYVSPFATPNGPIVNMRVIGDIVV